MRLVGVACQTYAKLKTVTRPVAPTPLPLPPSLFYANSNTLISLIAAIKAHRTGKLFGHYVSLVGSE